MSSKLETGLERPEVAEVAAGGRSDLNERIGAHVRALRAGRDWSLDALAARSGVSRSAISLIERGRPAPRRSCWTRSRPRLGVPLASLFDPPADAPVTRPGLPPRRATGVARSAVGLLPAQRLASAWPSPIRIVEVSFPSGATVTYETGAHEIVIHQQVWVLAGTLEVTVRGEIYCSDAAIASR